MGLTVSEALVQWLADSETREWIESRPPKIRAMVERTPPGTWWKMPSGVGIYTPVSYAENGTLTVQKYDPLFGMEYQVFGVKPDDLTWTLLTPDDPYEAFV
jgi:hypothetical protein